MLCASTNPAACKILWTSTRPFLDNHERISLPRMPRRCGYAAPTPAIAPTGAFATRVLGGRRRLRDWEIVWARWRLLLLDIHNMLARRPRTAVDPRPRPSTDPMWLENMSGPLWESSVHRWITNTRSSLHIMEPTRFLTPYLTHVMRSPDKVSSPHTSIGFHVTTLVAFVCEVMHRDCFTNKMRLWNFMQRLAGLSISWI